MREAAGRVKRSEVKSFEASSLMGARGVVREKAEIAGVSGKRVAFASDARA
jgi:hypothetical protein